MSGCSAEISTVLSAAACSWPLSEDTRIRAISSNCEGTPDSEACPLKKEKERHVSANFVGREQLSDAGRVIVIAFQLTLTKLTAIIV